ncbi:MAG: hypothetical protein KKB70_03160 [Proteobacteria bacterium]|nr:hypothetical protein [Pseudomonadota bacterium]MBU1611469.1 hypothetical protein [Pseudomonadota bacterium]
MSTIESRRSEAKTKAVVFGLMSTALYGTVFTFSEAILEYCARGHFYTLLPVATVFLFSYIHGSFASNVWTAIGIEASSSASKKVTKTTTTTARKQAVAAN